MKLYQFHCTIFVFAEKEHLKSILYKISQIMYFNTLFDLKKFLILQKVYLK